MALSDAQKLEVAAFLGGREELLRAFDVLWSAIGAWEGVSLEIKRTQISFRAGVLFGCVSLRGRRMALSYTLPEPRTAGFSASRSPIPGDSPTINFFLSWTR